MLKLEFIKLFIYFIVAVLLVSLLIFIGLLLVKDSNLINKRKPVECGGQTFGSGKSRIEINFFLVAIIFIVFEIETILLIPYLLLVKLNFWFSIIVVMFFIFILCIGLLFEYAKQAFSLDSKIIPSINYFLLIDSWIVVQDFLTSIAYINQDPCLIYMSLFLTPYRKKNRLLSKRMQYGPDPYLPMVTKDFERLLSAYQADINQIGFWKNISFQEFCRDFSKMYTAFFEDSPNNPIRGLFNAAERGRAKEWDVFIGAVIFAFWNCSESFNIYLMEMSSEDLKKVPEDIKIKFGLLNIFWLPMLRELLFLIPKGELDNRKIKSVSMLRYFMSGSTPNPLKDSQIPESFKETKFIFLNYDIGNDPNLFFCSDNSILSDIAKLNLISLEYEAYLCTLNQIQLIVRELDNLNNLISCIISLEKVVTFRQLDQKLDTESNLWFNLLTNMSIRLLTEHLEFAKKNL